MTFLYAQQISALLDVIIQNAKMNITTCTQNLQECLNFSHGAKMKLFQLPSPKQFIPGSVSIILESISNYIVWRTLLGKWIVHPDGKVLKMFQRVFLFENKIAKNLALVKSLNRLL